MWNDQVERFATCQTFGHAWIPQSQAKSGWTPDYGHGIVLSCERCGCERRDTIDLNGDLSARSYDYPAGYQRDPAVIPERPTRGPTAGGVDDRVPVVPQSPLHHLNPQRRTRCHPPTPASSTTVTRSTP